MFLGYLKQEKYSISYISKGLTCLKYHPNLDVEYLNIAMHPDVRNALANLRKSMLQTEDNRIPLTTKVEEEFEKIMDKDFTPNTALTMKTGIWLGLTCMLRLGELVYCTHTYDVEAVHAIPFDHIEFDETAITLTFKGWKTMQHRRSLIFPYLKGTAQKVFNLLKDYTDYRQKTAAKGVSCIIINENGSKMQRQSWELMWHHVIDHSSWVGLNVSSQSMRIRGVTARHREGMEILEIMRLGHWQDNTINSYLRPELCHPPEKLRKIVHFHTKRSEECHVLCDCPKKNTKKTEDLVTSKYQKCVKSVRMCFLLGGVNVTVSWWSSSIMLTQLARGQGSTPG